MPQNTALNKTISIYNWIFAFFASLKLTLVVLILLSLGLFVGMFWDQTLALDEHMAYLADAQWLASIFVFFELYDVFHSWWFGVVVVFLALNLIACSIERLPKIWIDIHHPERILSDRLLKRLPQRHQIISTYDQAQAFIIKEFPKKVYREVRDGDHFVFAEKHKYARCGVYVVHIALLMIMFGSMMATNLGIDGMMMIVEGDVERSVRVKGPGGLPYQHELDFGVVCNDFRLKTFVDGSPMEFESDLAIVDQKSGKATNAKTIRVNEPLQYAGYTFYQASYQPLSGEQLVRLSIGPHAKERKTYILPIGARVEMPDKTVLVPLEIMDDYGGLGTAIKVQQIDPRGEVTHFVVFRQYPDFDPSVRRGQWDVLFQGFDQTYATGISVGRVPCIGVVFAGFVVMFIGLFMAFFMSHRRYFVRIKKLDEERCELSIAGIARRHQHAFVEEFQKWVERVNRVQIEG